MKNPVQEERMRNYFLEAAREIVKAEGIAAASTRTIAERAGYSYATIYNYFKDLNELLAQVRLMFLDECREYVKQETDSSLKGADFVYAAAQYYARYFVQYPAVFSLLFCDNSGTSGNAPVFADSIAPFFDALCEGKISCSDAGFIRYKLALHGLLLFSLKGSTVMNYNDFMFQLESLRL